MPGEYPEGNENPYRASNLDPRVDGGKMGSAINQPSSSLPSRTRDSDHATTGPAPSTLTTTADPAARSAEYAASADTKMPSTTAQIPVQSQSTPVATAESGEQQTMIGRTLGAIGLGGAASAAAGYLGYGTKADSTEEPRDTSAVASQPGLVSQETGPPRHYRRESIPTTAYPGGPNSPRAVAPPVGGTRESIDRGLGGSDSRISNDRGIGGTSATTEGVAGSGFGLGSAASGVPKEEYSQASNTRENIAGQSQQSDQRSHQRSEAQDGEKKSSGSDDKTGLPGTATADAIDAGAFPLKQTNAEAKLLGSVDKDPATVGGPSGNEGSSSTRGQDSSSHAGRDIAAGGAAAAATGAGAHALQHHEKSEDLRSSASQDAGRDQTLSGGQSYTISHQTAPVDAISSRDPNTRDTASGATGLGSSSSANAPMEAVASAPRRYDGQDYNQRDSHAGRDTALGAGAAAAGVGGLSHASQDRSSNNAPYYDAITVGSGSGSTGATRATGATGATGTTGQIPNEEGFRSPGSTVHDVTTTGQSRDSHTGRDVGLGAAAGGAAYAAHEHSNDRDLEKQREHDAKEAEKREKHHQKELEKQEKHHHKEMEKEEKKHEKTEREAAEKREKARLADEEEIRKRHEREAAAGVGAAGAAGEAHHHEKEKKPSIFKRIFKSRKNKDTGEDEDYSTDDEEDKARHATAGSNTGRGHHSGTGGEPRDSITGLAYDPSKDPEAAARLSAHEGTGHIPAYGSENATEGSHIMGSEPLGYVGDTKR